MQDQRNLLVAIVVSLAILLGFQYFYEAPRVERAQQLQEIAAEKKAKTPEITAPGEALPRPAEAPASPTSPSVTADTPVIGAVPQSRKEVLGSGNRIPITSPRLHGSISLKGGRLDDVTLVDYRQTVRKTSPEVVLLSPAGTREPYYVQSGWIAAGDTVAVPGPETVWTADGTMLTPETPVTLRWSNGQGLVFERLIALDRDYMFTITQTVQNQSGREVTLYPYSFISRSGTPPTSEFFILHEGPVGVFNGTLEELDYDDVQEAGKIDFETTGGWLGLTDHYWLVAAIPDQSIPVKARFLHSRRGADKYQADYLGAATVIPPGESGGTTGRVFAGAKEVKLLDRYAEDLSIAHLDLAVDFGWFYFLTKPIFYILNYFHALLGNFGLGILLLTVLVKLAFFPLANRSYRAMSKMKVVQPQMMELREKFKDDRNRMNQELMALYKREKINPAAGCLPILIQIPVFFALYKVLFVTIEMRHAPFYGWIEDLSAPDPTTIFNFFGLLPWGAPDLGLLNFLHVGLWPIIMGVSMYLQQKLNPQPADPMQARIFLALPIVFTFLLAQFPAGLVIYWAWNNLLSIGQQWMIMRKTEATA